MIAILAPLPSSSAILHSEPLTVLGTMPPYLPVNPAAALSITRATAAAVKTSVAKEMAAVKTPAKAKEVGKA